MAFPDRPTYHAQRQSLTANYVFKHYPDYEYSIAAAQLILAMLGMGATLSWYDFRDILRRPQGIGFVLLGQYVLFPLVAVAVSRICGLSVGISIGLLMVTVMPSGSVSNIFTHLGNGNVPLSITATTASTLSCLVLTPWILRLFVSNLSDAFQMPTLDIMRQILLCMIMPLAIGMIIGHYCLNLRQQISRWLIRASMAALACIVVGALGSGRLEIWRFGWTIPVFLVAFGIAKFFLTETSARLARFNDEDAFTMAIEVGVRNCNLAVLLLSHLFPAGDPKSAPLGGAVLYVVLFYGGASLFIAAYPIIRRRTSH